MFYDYNLMTSSALGVVWCYANQQKGVSDNVGIPKICSTIEKLVDYGSSRKNRVSLRTGTLLINGTARLYKEELDKLYQDCIQLNSQMLYRRSQDTSLADDNNSGSISEENLRNSKNGNRSRSGRSRRYNPKNISGRSHTNTKGSIGDSNGSSAMISSISDQSHISNRIYTIEKADAEIQTIKSYIANQKEKDKYKRKKTIDVNSPTGVIMVYDEFSNLPSKIICGNINKNVKFL